MEKKGEQIFPFKLKVGDVIPLLKLPSNKHEEVSTWNLKQLKNLVIFFNHGNQCDFCREKLKALAAVYTQMKRLETEVLAVSFNGVNELEKQAVEDDIPFPLLADSNRDTTARFTYVDEKKSGPYPSIFITDRYGELRKQEIESEANRLLNEEEIFKWLQLMEIECPECSHL